MAKFNDYIYDVTLWFQSEGILVYTTPDEFAQMHSKWYHVVEGAVVADHISLDVVYMAAGKDWQQIDTNVNATSIALANYAAWSKPVRHIKFVGYWGDDSTKVEVLDYSTIGPYFWGYDSSYPNCYVYSAIKKKSYYFKNNYGTFELYDETLTQVMGTDFHCMVCYIFM